MRVLVHLSDLHFGRTDEALITPLHRAIAGIRPSLVVVSGDLTQRARRAQFRRARTFLNNLPAPHLVVPGNHDVPLFDLVRRFLRPLARYQRYINPELEPFYVDHEIAVAGLNTARSLTLQGGRLNQVQLDRMRRRLARLDRHIVRIIVMHHPLAVPAGHEQRGPVGRADMAMETLAECRVDVCLAGHLHVGHVGRGADLFDMPGHHLLLVQAGTATSTRGRGESNSFNVLHVEESTLLIERHGWDPDAGRFRIQAQERFRREADGWRSDETPR
jgi:3',5'-cyclic AMP phosphodiesterase CpdA